MGRPISMVTQMDLVKLNGLQNKTKCREYGEDTGGKEGYMCMGWSGSGEMAQRMKYLCECEDNWYGTPCNSSLRRSLGQTG